MLILSITIPVFSDDNPMRIAVLNADFSRDGPGILVRDLLADEPELDVTITAILNLDPDIILLTDIDQDDQKWAATLLAERMNFTHHYQGRTNRGVQSGFDIDRDGWIDQGDAIGFGEFRGQHGMTIFSKSPITDPIVFTQMKWSETDGAIRPAGYFSDVEWNSLLLSTSGIWDVSINGIRFIASYAATPAFDGEEDRNGLRNMAENLWLDQYLRGAEMLDDDGTNQSITSPFIALGTFNLDPNAGDGQREVMANILSNPRVKDYGPQGPLGLATGDWRDKGYGALRADYILPSCEFKHIDGGMIPIPNNAHFLIWLDLTKSPNCE